MADVPVVELGQAYVDPFSSMLNIGVDLLRGFGIGKPKSVTEQLSEKGYAGYDPVTRELITIERYLKELAPKKTVSKVESYKQSLRRYGNGDNNMILTKTTVQRYPAIDFETTTPKNKEFHITTGGVQFPTNVLIKAPAVRNTLAEWNDARANGDVIDSLNKVSVKDVKIFGAGSLTSLIILFTMLYFMQKTTKW